MPDRITCPLALAACLCIAVPGAAADDSASPADSGPTTSEVRLDVLQSASAFMHHVDGFEVVVSTIVRDARGTRLGPPSNGRVCFRRTDAGPQFVIETWGGLGSAHLACDGETLTIADPATRCHESRPLPCPASAWLDDESITARFGPAAMHLLGLVLDDGLTAFRATGQERPADLGPTRAVVVPCRGVRDGDRGGDVRLAFASDGPPVPLAVAVLLEDGGVVELEFHDWRLGRPTDEAMALRTTADWRKVAALPRPSHLPAVEGSSDARVPTGSAEAVIAGAESLDRD